MVFEPHLVRIRSRVARGIAYYGRRRYVYETSLEELAVNEEEVECRYIPCNLGPQHFQ